MIDRESGSYASADAPTLSFSHCASLPSHRVTQMKKAHRSTTKGNGSDQPAAQTRTRHHIGGVCSAVFCRIHQPANGWDDSCVSKKPRQTAT
jgi:hypothetical protein